MARKRMVSPELLTSRTVASLPIPTRYAFVALWMYVDDEGRGVDDLDLIKAHSWPLDRTYSVRKVAEDLRRLTEKGMLCRYERDGSEYFHLPAWVTWQRVQHPTPSRIPPCPGELYSKGHAEYMNPSRGTHEPLIAKEVSSKESNSSEPGDAVPEGADDVAARVANLRERARRPA